MADLELRNISKSFGGIYALKNVSFHCNRGEVHALLGENGAGKSTLLKVLSGAYQPDGGEIYLFGKKANIHSPISAMNYGIGTVYQELSIIPDLKVSENIFIGRIPRKKTGDFDEKKLRNMTLDLLNKYGAGDIDPDAVAGNLSLSKRQMIEILRVLSKNPDIVILDEATSALTEERVQWLLGLAKQLAMEQKIVIFISHRMAEIREGCDTMTILRNGESVATMQVKNADIDQVVAFMLGHSMKGFFPEVISHVQPVVSLSVEDLVDNGALNGVSFQVHRGEVFGIGGLAGQGQTELLLALYGEHDAHGRISFDGKPLKLKSSKAALRNGIALVPEDRGSQGAITSLSIRFNISLPSLKTVSSWLHISKYREKQLVDTYMKSLQVKANSTEMLVKNLSGGNQQKVVLAKILATHPSVLLLHDITRGVDIGTKKEMFQLVRDQASQGKTVVFFSTDTDELVNICDRVMVMYDGKAEAILTRDSLTRENIIAASIGEGSAAMRGEVLR